MKKLHTFVVLAYKESQYLEECLKSVTNQSLKTNVIIATTTDNEHIRNLAQKYKLSVITDQHTTIGGDFDFAKNAASTPLVTIAHQDDIYDYDYAKTIVNEYQHHPNASIIFTDYYEIRNNQKVVTNKNLKIKRILLTPLKIKKFSSSKFLKRLILRFGNSICCPAVTFVNTNCPAHIFTSNYKCNVDWLAWERLSQEPGAFIFNKNKLMGHRISTESTTTNIINSGIRTQEDYEMFCKFWPKSIAKFFTNTYKNSEKSNTIKKEEKG